MEKPGLNELRERFLKFFENKGHLRLPSFSLVPRNDPSILLINAGMTPLKPYFTGKETPPSRRVTTCQKCVRVIDIENVGKTSRHATFFEMLGNFSFGDYFKKEAIPWAWEFFTVELGIPGERLSVSIYEEDDEAFEIWNRDVGLPPEKIFRMGKEDNFWEHGTGPCGPCSEIYFDRGADKGCGKPGCSPRCGCDRHIEVWNLVFTQFDRQEDGSYKPLENKNIDTGMGLERLACVMQGVDSIFEVDAIKSVLKHICGIAGLEYGRDCDKDVSIRIITDHIRSASMLISDGVMPSNEGRGYVLRRLMRRAARHGKLLGIRRGFLAELADTVIDLSGKAYPHMEERRGYIKKVIDIEEEKFGATVDQGLGILSRLIEEVKSRDADMLPGDMVFKLHDTFGFPLDLTREIAQENALKIDVEGFEKEMAAQREKSREALKSREGSAWEKDAFGEALGKNGNPATEFVGYGEYSCEAKVIAIINNNEAVRYAQEGDSVAIALDRTSFYAESGGQVGDTGWISSRNGKARINGCKKAADGIYLHIGTVESGVIEKGEAAKAEIDVKRRMAIARNHTATHLLHKALKNILGEHVNQAGSLVEPERLRFDFTHFEAVTQDEIERIEKEVNEKIMESLEVITREMPVDEALKLGAAALFGEKYGSVVRVVSIDGYSLELCGGTHLKTTSQAGLFKIEGEGGIAAGIRRIEALTGEAALKYLKGREALLNAVADALKAAPQEAVKKAEYMARELKDAKKEIEKLRAGLAKSAIEEALSKSAEIEGLRFVAARFDGMDAQELRNASDELRNKMRSGIVVLASAKDGRANFIVSATKDAVERGVHSGEIVKEVARAAGGGGGGRPDMAQAGGKDASKIDDALKQAAKVVEKQLMKSN